MATIIVFSKKSMCGKNAEFDANFIFVDMVLIIAREKKLQAKEVKTKIKICSQTCPAHNCF